jgi:hypothetical protein
MALMIWGSGIYYGQYVTEYYQSVSIRIKEGKVTKKAILRALENESVKGTKKIPSVTAWNRMEGENIENRGLSTSILVNVIEVYGDMKQAYPMELIEGSLLNTDDYQGCIIDEEVAYELYRTRNVIGNSITYENKQYNIRGIMKSMEPTFLIQISNDDNAYSNLELVYKDKENGEQLALDFIMQNDLASSYTIIEGCFYANILELLYQLPAWFLGFYMLWQIVKAIWKRRTLPIQVLILFVCLIVSWFLLKWLMEFRIYIPERLIPTKWSNFSFWTKKYTSFRNQMKQIAYLTPVPKDMILFKYITRCIQSILITLVSMIVFTTHKNLFLEKSSGIKMSLLIILLECVTMVLLFKTGKEFQVTKGYLCMLPLFVIMEDYVNRGRELLLYLIIQKTN